MQLILPENFGTLLAGSSRPLPFRIETAAVSLRRMQGNTFSFRKFARNRDLEDETRKQRSTKLGKDVNFITRQRDNLSTLTTRKKVVTTVIRFN